jgi:CBS domain-containing protein
VAHRDAVKIKQSTMPKPTQPKTPQAPKVPLKTLAVEKAGALDPDDTVETAGVRMREHDAGAWPVAEDRKLVGMIDQKNPDWRIGGEGHDPKTWKVGEIMNHEAIFCYEDEDCTAARLVMDERGLAYLPVVDREMRIVGIFSRHEIQEKAEAAQNTGAKS